MREFFRAYKEYIVKHKRKSEFKPTTDKFDKVALYDAYKDVKSSHPMTDADVSAIYNFTCLSQYLHDLYENLYQRLDDDLNHLSLKGIDVGEYIVAVLNREYKVVSDKHKEAMLKAAKGSYNASDLSNFKIQSPNPNIGMIDARAALESLTDSAGLLLNNLRHYLDKQFSADDVKPNEFAGRLQDMMSCAHATVVLKHSYDDILYNNGFVLIDENNHQVTFDYESRNDLLLLFAGDMMFPERRLFMLGQQREGKVELRLRQYVTNRRIKKVHVNDSCVKLDFSQGEPKDHKGIADDLQAAVDSYYEFLDGNLALPNFHNATIDEAISVWGALQYIAYHITNNVNFDVSLFKREDFETIPTKVLKADLVDYVVKLTDIRANKVKLVLEALQADWGKYNDIWSAMLYIVGDYYLLPFYPLIFSSPFNIIDSLLQKGGISLDDRGIVFEQYLYKYLTTNKTSFPITCMPTRVYGVQGDSEEIDVLIGMKDTILVADAKCIHYSMEPMNYADAWNRLKEGCEQAVRKAEFVKVHPRYFPELGDYTQKKFITFVVTNYPTFTGFSHNGVYVIDSHSLLAYLQGGYMTMRQLGLDGDPVLGAKRFYHTESQYCNNFEDFLKENPIKAEFKNRLYIHDLPIMAGVEPWKVIAKCAQLRTDPQFDISNEKTDY